MSSEHRDRYRDFCKKLRLYREGGGPQGEPVAKFSDAVGQRGEELFQLALAEAEREAGLFGEPPPDVF